MRSLARKSILNITPYLPGKPIEEVKRELGLQEVIKLASNECPFPPSPKVLQAITLAARDLNRYPDGGCYHLRQALSRRLGVSANQIIFGNGSDEIIVMAVRSFVNEGDEVQVKVLEVDRQGKIRLSRKVLLEGYDPSKERERPPMGERRDREDRGGFRPGRSGRGGRGGRD